MTGKMVRWEAKQQIGMYVYVETRKNTTAVAWEPLQHDQRNDRRIVYKIEQYCPPVVKHSIQCTGHVKLNQVIAEVSVSSHPSLEVMPSEQANMVT